MEKDDTNFNAFDDNFYEKNIKGFTKNKIWL